MKKILIIVGVLFLLMIISEAVSWFGPLFFFDLIRRDDKVAQRAEEVMREHASVPTAQYSFYPVTEEMRNLELDCKQLSFVPQEFRNAKYFCQNIYNTDENKIVGEVGASGASRVILYGQYSSYNCPARVSEDKNILQECYSHAKFLDNYQFQKMAELFGMEVPKDKVNFYITYTQDQTKEICNRNRKDNAGLICLTADNTIYIPASYLKLRLGDVVTGYQFERKGNTKITYDLKLVFPRNCPVSNLHEMQHFFNFQNYGRNVPTWFEESMVAQLQNVVNNEICPPGVKVKEAYREDANGQKTKIDNYDMFSLSNEEPLESDVERLAENNQCRRGIDMIMSRYIDKYRAEYLPVLFAYLRRQGNLSTESNIAKGILATVNNDSRIKDFLLQNSCTL